MNNFITALQFLTRIRLFKQTSWQEDSFSKSVVWFPLVGAVIGLVLAGLNYVMLSVFDPFLRAVILVVAEILITGGILCDGLMDTSDGVFSGRADKERILEIMKDSRVGSNGVIIFFCLFIFKIGLYNALDGAILTSALFAMPIVTRFAMCINITHFKYARPEGIGGLFTKYSKKSYTYIGCIMAIVLIAPLCSVNIYLASIATVVYCCLVACYLSSVLDGLTGDTYGFVAETGNVVFIFLLYVCLLINFGGLAINA